MKKIFFARLLLMIIVLFWPFTIKSQNTSLSNSLDTCCVSSFAYLTIVDGKIPYSVLSKLSYKHNGLSDTVIYDCYYINNKYYSENISTLSSLPDSIIVFIDIFFEETIGINKTKTHHYHDEMPLGRFRLVQIISITNFHHDQYYMYYVFDPPLRTFPDYNKRFGSKKKFYSKVFSCYYPYSYSQTSKGKKARPSY